MLWEARSGGMVSGWQGKESAWRRWPGVGETGHGGRGRQPREEEIQGKGGSGERAVCTERGRPRGALEILMPREDAGGGTLEVRTPS